MRPLVALAAAVFALCSCAGARGVIAPSPRPAGARATVPGPPPDQVVAIDSRSGRLCVRFGDDSAGVAPFWSGGNQPPRLMTAWRSDRPVRDIACGAYVFCLLDADDTLRCQDYDHRGPMDEYLRLPGARRAAVMAGGGVCAVGGDGSAQCAGPLDQRAIGGLRRLGRVRELLPGTFCALLEGERLACANPQTDTEPYVLLAGVRQASVVFENQSHRGCAAMTDGTVRCWGLNTFGELGDGTRTRRDQPTPVPGLTGVRQVSFSGAHACALTGRGEAYCWGRAMDRETGPEAYDRGGAVPVCPVDQAATQRAREAFERAAATPCPPVTSPRGDDVCGRMRYNLARSGASVEPVYRTDGHCLDPRHDPTRFVTTPTRLRDADGAVALEALGRRTCALRADGSLRCWGGGFAEPYALTMPATQRPAAAAAAAAARSTSTGAPAATNAAALAALRAAGAVCTDAGWCWQTPRPHGEHIADAFAAANGEAWFVGGDGRVLHRDARGGWTYERPFGAHTRPIHVTGSGPADVWITGVDQLAHWDGAHWTNTEAGHSPRAVLALAPRDAWAIDALAHMTYRWDGLSFQPVRVPDSLEPDTVWAAGPGGDVWLAAHRPNTPVSAPSVLLRWSGREWVPQPALSVPARVATIAGSSPADVWFVGGTQNPAYGAAPAPFAARFDGGAMRAVPLPTQWTGEAPQLLVFGPRDAWIARGSDAQRRGVLHWDGARWSAPPGAPESVTAITGGATGLYAVGYHGELARWDGRAWRDEAEAMLPESDSTIAQGLWARAPDDAWLVGEYNDRAVRRAAHGAQVEVRRGFALHYDGARWRPSATGLRCRLARAWGTARDDVWAVGETSRPDPANTWAVGCAAHFDGAQWRDVEVPPLANVPDVPRTDLHGVWASGPRDVWAVGFGGVVVRFDGARWTQVQTPTLARFAQLGGVWGAGPNDVWIVGGEAIDGPSIALHWDGRALTRVAMPPVSYATAVWGAGPNDVWAAGWAIAHWDGRAWSVAPGGARQSASELVTFNALVGTGPRDVWSVDSRGRVWRWDGAAWTSRETGAGSGLASLALAGAHDAWVAGGAGVLHLAR